MKNFMLFTHKRKIKKNINLEKKELIGGTLILDDNPQ